MTLYANETGKRVGFRVPNFQVDTGIRPIQIAALSDTTREYILEPGENPASKIRKNLFVKAHADKSECYIGEPVMITYKLYSRLVAKSQISKQPALSGFSVYDMIDFASGTESTEQIQNRAFKVYTLRKAQLVPLQQGTMQLDPIEVDNTIHFIKSNTHENANAGSLQDLVNQLSKEESSPSADVSIKIQSRPVDILVKSFPVANRPIDFNGAIGRFNIQAFVTTKNLSVNDAGLLKVVIKGIGNIALIDAPPVKWPEGIDTLDIRFNEQINKSVYPLAGVKTFEYVFTPLKKGVYKIPPISFSFFDAANHTYKTVETPSNVFEVAAGNKPPIRKESDDLLLQKKKDPAGKSLATYLKGESIWILAVISLLVLSLFLWRKNKILLKKTDKVKRVESSADEKLQAVTEKTVDILSESRTLLEKEDYKGFYSELNAVLWNELAVKLKLAPTALNKSNIAQVLKQRGWTDEMINRLDTVLIRCERSIYLPDYHQETDATMLLDMVQKLVSGLKNG